MNKNEKALLADHITDVVMATVMKQRIAVQLSHTYDVLLVRAVIYKTIQIIEEEEDL